MINGITTDEAESIGNFIEAVKTISTEVSYDCIFDSNGFVIGLTLKLY